MKIIIEDKDYIDAITPFRNGCSFRIHVTKDKRYMMEPGCSLISVSISSYKYELYKLWEKNKEKPFEINISMKLKRELLKVKNCEICGGLSHEL